MRPDQAPIARGPSDARKADSIIARLPGVSSAPPIPCTTSRPMQDLDGRGDRAEQGGHGEDADAEDEDSAAPVTVAQRTAEEDQRGQRERVAVEDPLERARRGVQIPADGRQRDVDNRPVEECHPRAEHRDRQHPSAGAARVANLTRCRLRDGGPPWSSGLGEALDEVERGLSHLLPAMVDRQRVAAVRDLLDLRDARVLALPLVGGVRDRPGNRVVLLAVDDQQRSRGPDSSGPPSPRSTD